MMSPQWNVWLWVRKAFSLIPHYRLTMRLTRPEEEQKFGSFPQSRP
jgi:hypothetical protein